MQRTQKTLIIVCLVIFLGTLLIAALSVTSVFKPADTRSPASQDENTSTTQEHTTEEMPSSEAVTEPSSNPQEMLAKSSLHACSWNQSSLTNIVCYTVQPHDSLWSIAERYLGSGWRWRELDTNPPNRETYINPGKQLWVGMEVGIHGSSLLPEKFRYANSVHTVVDVAASPYNDDVFFVVNNRIDDSKTAFFKGKEYDDGSVKTSDGYRVPNQYASITNIGFKENGDVFFVGHFTPSRAQDFCDLFVDHVQYGFWCGDEVQNPVFSPNGKNFVLRTNGQHPDDRDRSEQVHIFGSYQQIPADGWFYTSELDSITWIDDNSYVYRRFDSKDWWIEIHYMDKVNNFEHIGPFDETVEITGVENGKITYSIEQNGVKILETYKKLR